MQKFIRISAFFFVLDKGVIKMDDLLKNLIEYAILKKASDIHFILQQNRLKIKLRTQTEMLEVYQDVWQPAFFEYLKFISRMDLTNPYTPQSGQFKVSINHHDVYCRFSMLHNNHVQTGVIRMLNTMHAIELDALSLCKYDTEFFQSLIPLRHGLVICVGPTNSGKTTTLHALLHEIAKEKKHKVVSLEDPIEIEDDSYLQLQINEGTGFTYDVGIEQLLRHDPDVICIGETRNSYTAKMVLRASLTGHFVLTSIHAKDGKECIRRLEDLGVSKQDLLSVCTAIISQRLYSNGDKKVCIYEIMDQKTWTMSFDMESILKILKRYLRKFQKVLKKDISWTHKQNTIVLVYRDEIEQFHALMNNGLSIDTLIHLVFKKSDAIIEQLKSGNSRMS